MFDLYGRLNSSTAKPVEHWNTGRVVASGNRLQHWLNGVKVVDAEIDSPEWVESFSNSKFENGDTFGKQNGHIWLQDHGTPVWYRNMMIRSH